MTWILISYLTIVHYGGTFGSHVYKWHNPITACEDDGYKVDVRALYCNGKECKLSKVDCKKEIKKYLQKKGLL